MDGAGVCYKAGSGQIFTQDTIQDGAGRSQVPSQVLRSVRSEEAPLARAPLAKRRAPRTGQILPAHYWGKLSPMDVAIMAQDRPKWEAFVSRVIKDPERYH